MFIKKKYGQSKILPCPFCENQAITRNMQGVPVCSRHKDKELPDIKCVCGTFLEIKIGKWGPYFNCVKCGNINFSKGLDNI